MDKLIKAHDLNYLSHQLNLRLNLAIQDNDQNAIGMIRTITNQITEKIDTHYCILADMQDSDPTDCIS